MLPCPSADNVVHIAHWSIVYSTVSDAGKNLVLAGIGSVPSQIEPLRTGALRTFEAVTHRSRLWTASQSPRPTWHPHFSSPLKTWACRSDSSPSLSTRPYLKCVWLAEGRTSSAEIAGSQPSSGGRLVVDNTKLDFLTIGALCRAGVEL